MLVRGSTFRQWRNYSGPLDYAPIVQGKRGNGTTQSLRDCGRGSGGVSRSMVVSLKGFIEDSERLIKEVCCTAEGDVNLLESLLPFPFLVEDLKSAMMFIHDRLLRIQHETIDGCHRFLHSSDRVRTVTDPIAARNDTNGWMM
jgi:hypothetical protein